MMCVCVAYAHIINNKIIITTHRQMATYVQYSFIWLLKTFAAILAVYACASSVSFITRGMAI